MGAGTRPEPPLTPLPWDSAHFGVSIARISCDGLTGGVLDACLAEAGNRSIRMLEAACHISDETTAQLLESREFRYAGTQVHLALDLEQSLAQDAVSRLRKAEETDLDALREMTWGSYTDSRYFSYPGIDPEKIHALYRIWVEKGVRGTFDDECRVLEQDGVIQAFCCLKFESSAARIGLFGVNPSFRRRGHGSCLLGVLKPALFQQGIKCIITTTQAKNIPALRLYENAGFMTSRMDLWFCRRIA